MRRFSFFLGPRRLSHIDASLASCMTPGFPCLDKAGRPCVTLHLSFHSMHRSVRSSSAALTSCNRSIQSLDTLERLVDRPFKITKLPRTPAQMLALFATAAAADSRRERLPNDPACCVLHHGQDSCYCVAEKSSDPVRMTTRGLQGAINRLHSHAVLAVIRLHSHTVLAVIRLHSHTVLTIIGLQGAIILIDCTLHSHTHARCQLLLRHPGGDRRRRGAISLCTFHPHEEFATDFVEQRWVRQSRTAQASRRRAQAPKKAVVGAAAGSAEAHHASALLRWWW
jgi:hypothetical protein